MRLRFRIELFHDLPHRVFLRVRIDALLLEKLGQCHECVTPLFQFGDDDVEGFRGRMRIGLHVVHQDDGAVGNAVQDRFGPAFPQDRRLSWPCSVNRLVVCPRSSFIATPHYPSLCYRYRSLITIGIAKTYVQ